MRARMKLFKIIPLQILCFLSSQFLLSADQSTAFMSSPYINEQLIPQKKLQSLNEGFVAGTKVKTTSGYKCIENLTYEDHVIGYNFSNGYTEASILNITPTKINYFIRIKTENNIIDAAPFQKFYLSKEEKWVKALTIKPNQCILKNGIEPCVIEHVEIINQETEVVTITVDSHHFYITPDDILVHNADPITLSATTIMIGSIIVINPVLTILGVTTALAATLAAYNLTQSKPNPIENENITRTNTKKNNFYPNEQSNYEQKKQLLIKLKQDFLKIIDDLKKISQLHNSQSINFTYEFLNPIQANPTPSKIVNLSYQNNLQFNDKQKEELKSIRENELLKIEYEILDLQITIAWHFNELIQRRNKALAEIDISCPQINKSINIWNSNLNNIPIEIAIICYENTFVEEEQLQKSRPQK